ncbi:MAG TPA: penicillin-binding protein activator, partial [Rhodanobacteraceae bacterium]|nr:penicillin-binding protein activator [Rhodanobacteraceae bacterium]
MASPAISWKEPTRAARWPAAALLALVLGACVTMPEQEPATSADAAHAETLYKNGDLDQAAAAFTALAESSGGDAAAHYRLRAAESLREAGDLEGAAHVLGDLKRRRLHGNEQIRLDLLDAEIALKHGDAAQAQALLTTPVDQLPENLRVRALELAAR